jgi:hypothetical protein
MNTRAFLLSALIAGVVMALLGQIPIINILNCVLCMWVWGSGILAIFLYRRFEPANPILSIGQGAGVGAVAGVVGAIIGAILSAIFKSAGWGALLSLAKAIAGPSADLDPIANLITTGGFWFISLGIDLVLYAFFGAVGGIIATALIWKKPKTTL